MSVNRKDLVAGLVFATLGVVYMAMSLQLEQGTALRMGPGRFPLLLAGGMAVFGAIIAIRSLFSGPMSIGAIPWRAVILILGAPIVFGLTLRGIGLVPAVFIMVLIASLADPEFDLRFSLLVSAGLALFCWLVFGLGLGLTVPPIGPWLAMR
jgi:hypothetical protein